MQCKHQQEARWTCWEQELNRDAHAHAHMHTSTQARMNAVVFFIQNDLLNSDTQHKINSNLLVINREINNSSVMIENTHPTKHTNTHFFIFWSLLYQCMNDHMLMWSLSRRTWATDPKSASLRLRFSLSLILEWNAQWSFCCSSPCSP